MKKLEISAPKNRFYYDVSIQNNIYTNPDNQIFPAIFQETRDQPLFNDLPKKYCMSVVRFSVPTGNIPYQIMPVMYDTSNPTNPNKTIYSITMLFRGIYYRQHIQWTTQNATVPIPAPPTILGGPKYKTYEYYEYYSLYSFEHLCDSINDALNDCYQNNIVPLLPAPPLGKSYVSPYMVFNGTNNFFTLWTPELFLFTIPANPDRVELGANGLFISNFSRSWSFTQVGTNDVNGYDFSWNLLNNNNNQVVNNTDPSGFIYSFEQEYDTTGAISKFSSILMTSTTIPVVSSNVSNTQNSVSTVAQVAGGFLPIITDFQVDKSTINNLNGSIQYFPAAEFRRINLKGDSPITQVDINVFVQDTLNNIYPLLLPLNTEVSLKILFEEQ